MEEIKEIIESGILDFELPDAITQIGATAAQYGKFVGMLTIGVLLISSLTHFLFGKANQINIAITAAMEILCLYVLNIVIYAMGLQYEFFLNPLPFITLAEDYLFFMPVMSVEVHTLCNQVVRLLIIAFLVNLIGGWIPQGQRLLSWSILRLITVALSVAALYAVDMLMATYLPQGYAEHAPLVLLVSLAALIALGSLKIFVGAALAFLDPIIAALYTFFFSNIIGRALARAMVTTILLVGLFAGLQALEITVLQIAASALKAYIPLLAVVVLLWYFVGRVLQKEK